MASLFGWGTPLRPIWSFYYWHLVGMVYLGRHYYSPLVAYRMVWYDIVPDIECHTIVGTYICRGCGKVVALGRCAEIDDVILTTNKWLASPATQLR